MHGREHHQRGGRGPEGRARRIRGFVEPALLLLLHDGPKHGYGLINGLEDVGFEDYPIDSSTVYRILRGLEAQAMIVSDWDNEVTAGPPRRVYQITPAGEAHLSLWIDDLRATQRILHRYLEIYDRTLGMNAGTEPTR
jgi:PadR family transcriptional regulator, regulatory protein PadR